MTTLECLIVVISFAVAQLRTPCSSETSLGNLVCGSEGENAGCIYRDDKFVQTAHIRGNNLCLNIPYPRYRSSGREAEAEMMAVIPSDDTSCVNLFEQENCQGGYFQYPGTIFGYKLLMPFEKRNILENFPIQPRSIQPLEECYFSSGRDSIRNSGDPNLLNDYRNGLALGLETSTPNETFTETATIVKNESCFKFNYGQSHFLPLDVSTLDFYNVTLKLSNSGRSVMPPKCLELFYGPLCDRTSVRRYTLEMNPGETLPLWRLSGKYANRSGLIDGGKTLAKLDSDVPNVFRMQTVKPCLISRNRQQSRTHASNFGGVHVEIIVVEEKFQFSDETVHEVHESLEDDIEPETSHSTATSPYIHMLILVLIMILLK